MLRLFITLFILIYFLSDALYGYVIKGEFQNMSNAYENTVYLSRITSISHFQSASKRMVIDSAHISKNNTFKIEGANLLFKKGLFQSDSTFEPPKWGSQKQVICRLNVVPKGNPPGFITGSKKYSIYLLLSENSNIRILANIQKVGQYSLLKGNPGSKSLKKLRQSVVKPIYLSAVQISQTISEVQNDTTIRKDSLTALKKKFRREMVENYQNLRPNLRTFIRNVKNPYVKLFAGIVHYDYDKNINNDLQFFKELNSSIKTSYPNALYTEQFNKLIDNTTDLRKKRTAPGFQKDYALLNEAGQNVQLNEWTGNIILLDFWASWCKPCRRAFQEQLKPLHEKYEPYNFKIISVALEKNKKRWLKALNEENLPWVTLWAKRYPEDQISKDYNVHSLPHYVLIDKDNSILYPGVSLPQIQQVLKKIFIEDSLDVYRTYSPFKKDSISITIERGSTKKEIKSIKQYLNKYGIEAVLTGKYDKHGKLESLSGTLKYKRQNGNVTFSSSNRMKKVIIKIESVGENPSISIFTEAKSLFNWK